MTITQYAYLIWHLVKRDFYLRHAGSALGTIWALAVPVAQLAVLTFTFSNIIRVDIDDYPAFVFCALLPWTWFANSLSGAGHLFFTHRDLLRRPAFPPTSLIIVNMLSHLITLLLSLPLLLMLLWWYERPLVWNPITLLALLVIQGLLTVGLSFVIATWNTFYRDIAPLVGIMLSLLFFLTPIFYRPLVSSEYLTLLALNPLVPLINGYRAVLFEGAQPQWDVLWVTGLLSTSICALGYWIYKRGIHDVVDLI